MALLVACFLCSMLVLVPVASSSSGYGGGSWQQDGYKRRVPRDVMVNVINDLGLALLEVHSEHNENNIAISPYGATSVLVALVEGLAGDAAHEIRYAIHLPQELSVVRIGLRDIHRHLKSYFIPKEGFLAGLTLSHENITLNREYESILRFYGYDVDSFNNPVYPEPFSTTESPSTTKRMHTTTGRMVTSTMPMSTTTESIPTTEPPTSTTEMDTIGSTENLNSLKPERTTRKFTPKTTLPQPADEGTSTTKKVPPRATTNQAADSTEDIALSETRYTTPITTSTPLGEISTVEPKMDTEPTVTTPMESKTDPEEITIPMEIKMNTGATETTTSTGNAGGPTVTTIFEETTPLVESKETIDTIPLENMTNLSTLKASSISTERTGTISMESRTDSGSTMRETIPESSAVETTMETRMNSGSTFREATGTIPMETSTKYEDNPATIPMESNMKLTGTTVAIPMESRTNPGVPGEFTDSRTTPDGTTKSSESDASTPTESSTAIDVSTILVTAKSETTTLAFDVLENELERLEATESENISTTESGSAEYEESPLVPEEDVSPVIKENSKNYTKLDKGHSGHSTKATVTHMNTNKDQDTSLEQTTIDLTTEPSLDLRSTTITDYDSVTSDIFPAASSTFEITANITASHVARPKRSVIDYLIARYYDNYYISSNRRYLPQPKPHYSNYQPDIPYTFLVNGKHRESNISFMTYDTVLPFYYIPELDAMALSFPLDSNMYYLLLILPVDEQGIDKLIRDFREVTSLERVVQNLKYTHVKAVIPSFTLKGYVVLTPSLQKLCIRKIFEPRHADFSQLTPEKDIYVTNIEQAVTVTIRNYMDPSSGSGRNLQAYRPVEFKADHPFLYFVMDSQIHVNLMAGKIMNPLNSRIR